MNTSTRHVTNYGASSHGLDEDDNESLLAAMNSLVVNLPLPVVKADPPLVRQQVMAVKIDPRPVLLLAPSRQELPVEA